MKITPSISSRQLAVILHDYVIANSPPKKAEVWAHEYGVLVTHVYAAARFAVRKLGSPWPFARPKLANDGVLTIRKYTRTGWKAKYETMCIQIPEELIRRANLDGVNKVEYHIKDGRIEITPPGDNLIRNA